MKRYCFDTSGLSHPLEEMPEDIHGSMWRKVRAIVEDGSIAVTTEIYGEMTHLQGQLGVCITENKDQLICEVNKGAWDWKAYTACTAAMLKTHHGFISEYNGNSPKTICLNDMSIIALGKTLALPVVSMEKSVMSPGSKSKRRIPDICNAEGVEHLTFNAFLRREKISI